MNPLRVRRVVSLLQASASAPGKVILLGEHAVVYGQPALSVSLSLRTRVTAQVLDSGASTIEGRPLDARRDSYLGHVLKLGWDGRPVALEARSEVPAASGMGSSAALTVAAAAALASLRGRLEKAEVARVAFEAEYQAQGGASPNDTSVCTAGGGILLAPSRITTQSDAEYLWRMAKAEKEWHVHRVPVPELPLVVGFSGVKARTADQIWKVRRFVETEARGKGLIEEIGRGVFEALDALKANDLGVLGALMDKNHAILNQLGVGHPVLEKLVEAARSVKGTYGAKVTGAGGGGSIVVLTADPDGVAKVMTKAGGVAFVVTASDRGVEIVPPRAPHFSTKAAGASP